jgi:hypothetical protein
MHRLQASFWWDLDVDSSLVSWYTAISVQLSASMIIEFPQTISVIPSPVNSLFLEGTLGCPIILRKQFQHFQQDLLQLVDVLALFHAEPVPFSSFVYTDVSGVCPRRRSHTIGRVPAVLDEVLLQPLSNSAAYRLSVMIMDWHRLTRRENVFFPSVSRFRLHSYYRSNTHTCN